MSQSETTKTPNRPAAMSIRRALPRWAQVSILLVVFASGCVFGAIVATKMIQTKMETYRTNAPVFASDISSRLRVRLDLTDEQAERVSEILERRHKRMIQSREEGVQAMHSQFDATIKEVSDVLDQQQLKKWQSVSESVRRRFLPPVASASASDPLNSQSNGLGNSPFGQQPTVAVFDIFDRDLNSCLSEDEVPGPVWQRLSTADSDNNGEVTRIEFSSFFAPESQSEDK